MEQEFYALGPKWFEKIKTAVGRGFVGVDEPGPQRFFRLTLTALLSGGHVLLSDVPGIGKTFILKAMARAIATPFGRVQCTIDLLPADITGSTDPTYALYEKIAKLLGRFDEKVVAQEAVQWGAIRPEVGIFLPDEINRLGRRTRSALLEAMEERQLTIGYRTYHLNELFMVVATQNPIEEGEMTPIGAAEADRFTFKMKMGYLSRKSEIEFAAEAHKYVSHKVLDEIEPVVSEKEVLELRREIQEKIYLAPSLQAYIVDVVRETRAPSFVSVEYTLLTHAKELVKREQPMRDPESGVSAVEVGASPRGERDLAVASKVVAWSNGRGYVLPEDIRSIAIPSLSHRIVLSKEFDVIMRRSNFAEAIVAKAIDVVPCPAEEDVAP